MSCSIFIFTILLLPSCALKVCDLIRHNFSVTTMADKLGIDFALIHRKRNGKSLSAPECMEILVGDVKDKVLFSPASVIFMLIMLASSPGGYSGR